MPLIFMSLMVIYVNFFMNKLGICVSSLKKCLFRSFVHFKIRLLSFITAVDLRLFLCAVDINPLPDELVANIFFNAALFTSNTLEILQVHPIL